VAYITADELREYIGSDTTNFEGLADSAVTVASQKVDAMCDRTFTPDSTATARVFDPLNTWCAPVDDFWTTTGLIVKTDDGGNGTYSTTWTLNTDFILAPNNGRQGGITGWPYTEIRPLNSRGFYTWFGIRRPPFIQVTAKWGWAAVPDAVKIASLMLAAQTFKMKDAPDGYVGLDGWGPVRIKENPAVRDILSPYMRAQIAVG
jgi:hypothetical protein